jgi:RNA polymerase sigma-70 factor (ECF subfamily)
MMQHQFLTLIEEHSAAINRVCRSFCHTAEDCEDLRQDIILNLWLGWSRYRPTAKPVTWVWRVAVNTGISWRRHRQPDEERLYFICNSE